MAWKASLLGLLESWRAREARLLRLLEASWPLTRKAGGRCDPTTRLKALLKLLWVVPSLHRVLEALLTPLRHESEASRRWKWWMVEVKERREPNRYSCQWALLHAVRTSRR